MELFDICKKTNLYAYHEKRHIAPPHGECDSEVDNGRYHFFVRADHGTRPSCGICSSPLCVGSSNLEVNGAVSYLQAMTSDFLSSHHATSTSQGLPLLFASFFACQKIFLGGHK